jgi:C4-dicarboxylate-specific signal transduction histidine kinase
MSRWRDAIVSAVARRFGGGGSSASATVTSGGSGGGAIPRCAFLTALTDDAFASMTDDAFASMTDDAFASIDCVHAPSVVDVNLVIEGMRRMLERLAGASLDLVVKLDDEPCVVNAEAEQLERVIVNLVTNARDAMAGHGTLCIETERAASTLVPHGDAVVVRVTDTGAGIDHATRPRIFEPFFTTKGHAGMGLGLAAVQDIVAACGGQVQVASEPGGGTRFEVLLPFSSACETRPASAPSSA